MKIMFNIFILTKGSSTRPPNSCIIYVCELGQVTNLTFSFYVYSANKVKIRATISTNTNRSLRALLTNILSFLMVKPEFVRYYAAYRVRPRCR